MGFLRLQAEEDVNSFDRQNSSEMSRPRHEAEKESDDESDSEGRGEAKRYPSGELKNAVSFDEENWDRRQDTWTLEELKEDLQEGSKPMPEPKSDD